MTKYDITWHPWLFLSVWIIPVSGFCVHLGYLANRNYTIGNCLIWTRLGLYSVIMTALDAVCATRCDTKNPYQKTDAQFHFWRTPRACATSDAKNKRICSGRFVVSSVDSLCCGATRHYNDRFGCKIHKIILMQCFNFTFETNIQNHVFKTFTFVIGLLTPNPAIGKI